MTATAIGALVAGAIRPHGTPTSDGEWDASAARRDCPSEEGPLREMHAWVDDGADPATLAAYKLPHHEVSVAGEVGAANMTACSDAIAALNGARGGADIPDADREAVHAHLARHMMDGGRDEDDIPPLTAAAGVDEAAPPMADTKGTPYRRWRMPIAVVEGVNSGDSGDVFRYVDPDVVTWREFPRPLMVLTKTTENHGEAELVGRIDSAQRVDASGIIDKRSGEPYGPGAFAIQLEGVLTNEELADRTAELIRGGFLKSVSVDMSDVEMVYELVDADGNVMDVEALDQDLDALEGVRMRERLIAGRIAGVTILPFEAFEEAYIELLDEDGNVGPATAPGVPGRRREPPAAVAAVAAPNPRRCAPCESGAVTAAAAPVDPPAEWFLRPDTANLKRSINITDEGRVFGQVGPEGVCHIGYLGECVTVPHSATGYAWFHLGSVKTAEGDVIPSGVITVDTGHADMRAGMGAAMAHYDDTGTAVADVVVGEDDLGVWFSGALRPDATPEQVRKLRGSKLSGDWRPVRGNRELMAVLAVNTPGFPVVRQLVASGQPGALIASFGVFPSFPDATPSELDEVRGLLPELRGIAERDRAARAAGARDRMAALDRSARAGALRARMGVGG